jgi:hypothetical protein
LPGWRALHRTEVRCERWQFGVSLQKEETESAAATVAILLSIAEFVADPDLAPGAVVRPLGEGEDFDGSVEEPHVRLNSHGSSVDPSPTCA